MDVVIVESPAKAKTINKYLGSNYKVLASFGHVRDLPAKDGSVRPDEDFAMSWEVDGPSSKRLAEIAKAVKEADNVILATDPDREGEAIFVARAGSAAPEEGAQGQAGDARGLQRHHQAGSDPRRWPHRARSTRRWSTPIWRAAHSDYLVGFTLSPVLWRKLPGARSAGRVQSVALRLVCDRETEIERFIREDYWQIAALLKTPRGEGFEARLTVYDGKKLQKLTIKSQEEADAIQAMLGGATFKAASVEAKPTRRNPAPPFTTSTLQQAASSRLGFSASRTMQVAQRLYEGTDIGGETTGLITYMRTDGVQMASEAIDSARQLIGSQFGDRVRARKAALLCHEGQERARRPTRRSARPIFSRTPAQVRKYLDSDQSRLYEMIWQRAVASQMQPAEIERTTVEIEAKKWRPVRQFCVPSARSSASTVLSPPTRKTVTRMRRRRTTSVCPRSVPAKIWGAREKIDSTKHTTEPPPRYSEASLIKRMEELGIGRPSTYAATLKTLEDRDYVTIDKRRLTPQPKGRLVTAFLESFFERYVEYDFTAALEEKLDQISDGKLSWKEVLRDFWQQFSGSVADIKELRVTEVLNALNEELAPLVFPAREDGSKPAHLPQMRFRQSVAEARQVRRLRRLLQLPRIADLRASSAKPSTVLARVQPMAIANSARIPIPARKSG